MILNEGDLRFDFAGAIDGFKFDEMYKSDPKFHGLSHCMKAVDFVVELNDYYLFVEIKDPPNPLWYGQGNKKEELIVALVTKFRDSFVYRWAEEKLDKPVKYLCLVEADNALVSYLMKELQRHLPAKGPHSRWKKPIAQTCVVANIARWNSNFPDWQVSRI